MNDWLLHMTDAQRIYAAGLISAMLHVLERPSHVPTARSTDWTSLSVRSLPDRRPGASVTLSRGKVILRTPLSPHRLKFAAEIVGPACPTTDVIRDGDVAVILVTLVGWWAALSSPVTSVTTAEVQETANALTSLLRGTVEAHRRDWELATINASNKDGPVVTVYHREPDGRQVNNRFADRASSRIAGGMSQAMTDEIDRVLGGRAHAHVVELERWLRYRLRFHATPTYCVSPASDPMVTLRALNALPTGARLVPASDRGRRDGDGDHPPTAR